jgi:hypothetical protein
MTGGARRSRLAATMAALRPSDRDALLSALLAAIAVAQALVAPIASLPVGLVIALLTTVPVAWRRSAPVAAAWPPPRRG